MMYRPSDLERIAKQVMQEVEDEISKSGLFYRIFYRCKDDKSLTKKLSAKNEDGSPKYDGGTKLLRDIIGIRINLYFVDDLELVTEFIKDRFKSLFVEETIDANTTTEFKPTRINLVFRLAERYQREFKEVIRNPQIDTTFELQLRTVISEGWHEVEHDLRYKCQQDWEPYPEMSRMFNGFLAALETQEWSMIQLFERITYQHYRNDDNLSAMIRTKLRIRFDDFDVSDKLRAIIEKDEDLVRELFKIDRLKVVKVLLKNRPLFPLTFDNILYLINYHFLKSEEITAVTPELILSSLQATQPSKVTVGQ